MSTKEGDHSHIKTNHMYVKVHDVRQTKDNTTEVIFADTNHCISGNGMIMKIPQHNPSMRRETICYISFTYDSSIAKTSAVFRAGLERPLFGPWLLYSLL